MDTKVFVVDDDEGILEAMQIMLETEGYQVTVSSKANGIVEKVQQLSPDVIILDVLLSGEDGREVARKLKQNSSTKKIPIIMISAHPSAEKTVKRYGADDFIPKPFEVAALLQKVEHYSNRKY